MEWQTIDRFKLPFKCTEGWQWNSNKKLPRAENISADTETKLKLNGRYASQTEIYQYYNVHGIQRTREALEVEVYCWSISNGSEFAIFQCIEDFLLAVATLRVKNVFWYNAKFDFSFFDSYFLRNGWINANERVQENKKNKQYKKLTDKTYSSLNGDFGQRYQYTIWKSYINNRSQQKVHKFVMYDICNIFAGGLRKNLIDWHIVDKDNKEVQKLTMDYDSADLDNDDDIQYIRNDTVGLALLSDKIDKTLKDISGFSLYENDYLTAGGLAKKTMLKFMYGGETKDNIKAFKKDFYMSTKLDEYLRKLSLYRGGKCLVNPYKCKVLQKNIFKYDVNSMYPAQMMNMLYPYGHGKVTDKIENDGRIKIIHITEMYGTLKPNKIGIWNDLLTGKIVDKIHETNEFYIWYEELQELEKWYYLTYEIESVVSYEAKPCKGIQEFIKTFYTMKCNNKGAVKNGAKLLLNSAYGKLSQRIEKVICEYELTENNIVHLVKKKETIDEKGMLSVVVGSRVTAMARVSLMTYIREICNENVKDNFIYCDTDSVHSLTKYDDTDDKELGKMKCEGVYDYGMYLAPKTYMLQDSDKNYECHCKGVNTKVVHDLVCNKPIEQAIEVFNVNKMFKCLTGINVKGGKALIYTNKYMVKDKISDDDKGFSLTDLVEF